MDPPPNFFDELFSQLAGELAPRVAAALSTNAAREERDEWRLLDLEDAAARLGRSTRWVRERVRRGDLPFVRLDGGALAFELDDLRAFARARRVAVNEPEALAARLRAGREPASLRGIRGEGQVGDRRVSP
jgi:hypothetical protein